MNIAVVVAIVIVGLILLGFRYRPTIFGGKKSPENELLLLCRGDGELLERLIAREQKRSPGQSRASAAKAAIYSLKRDNR